MPISNTQTVLAPIAPNSVNDLYATHSDTYGEGGYRSITSGGTTTATASEIGAQIPLARRKVGMLIYDTSTSKYYRCTATAGDGSYGVEDFGSTGGSVTSVGLSMPSGFTVGNTPITSNGDLTVSTSLSGIIKGTGAGFAAAVAGVDYAQTSHTHPVSNLASIAANRLVGRYSNTTGSGQAIQVGSGLDLDTSTGVLTSTGLGGTVTTIGGVAPIGASTGDQGVTYSITHANSGVTAGTYGAAGTVPVVSVNATGHVTEVTTAAISGFLPTSGGSVTGNVNVTGDVTLSGATSDLAVGGNATISGDLTVNGTTTTINSTTLSVDDKNIELGSVGSPSNTTADGGGITLKGATDKTFNWVNSTSAWTSSEDLNLISGKAYEINGTTVLTANALGSGVIASSLQSVGTLTSGTWNASTIAVNRGGTGTTTLTGLVKGNGTSAFTAAVAGSDYLAPNATIDGGTY